MLAGTERREVAATFLGLRPYALKASEHILAQGGKRSCVVPFLHKVEHTAVIAVTDQIAGAMSGVVADIERFVSFRSRSVGALRHRIGQIYAACLERIFLYLLEGGLGIC